ncbi:hypothetical protein DFH06DRAFT_1334459 [Mycena polygramma]|nr:hypothetical protein DFH06DRAFT_1334459 [Mycena polygramma]
MHPSTLKTSNPHVVTSVPREPTPPLVRPTAHPLSLRTILNPVPEPEKVAVGPSPYRNMDFLPITLSDDTAQIPSQAYRFITPCRYVATSKLRTYVEDYGSPPIKVRLESRVMKWQAHFFTMVCAPRIPVTKETVLAPSGGLNGRWTIDQTLCKTPDFLLVRIKDRFDYLVTILAIPHRYVNIPDPDPETQALYEPHTHPLPTLPPLDMVRLSEGAPWNNLGSTQSVDEGHKNFIALNSHVPAAPTEWPALQWMETVTNS